LLHVEHNTGGIWLLKHNRFFNIAK